MKNKHLSLLMAVIICFSLVCGTVSAADIVEEVTTQAVQSEEETTKSINDTINDKFEEVFSSTPSEVGKEVMDGVYEAHSFLEKVMEVINNIKIMAVNFINTIFSRFNFNLPIFQ